MSESEPPSELDVSDCQFTVATSCMLKTLEFMADSDIVKLGEFGYRTWYTKCIRKLVKAGEDEDFNAKWVSGRAVISARGIAKANALSIVIEDETEWRKVKTFVERWIKEGKQEIIVKLTGTWRKKKGNIILDDDDEQRVGKPRTTVCTQSFHVSLY